MRILNIAATVDPAIGGVPEAAVQLTRALRSAIKRSDLLTLDDPGSNWLPAIPELIDAIGPSRGSYCYNARLIPWLKNNHANYDVIISHGIWQYSTLGAAYVAKQFNLPHFVYVHGQLDPWFKKAFPLKHLKKWMYWPWGAHYALNGAHATLFTTEDERQLARQSFWLYRVKEAVASIGLPDIGGNGDTERDAFFQNYPSLREKRLVLFMSRIHQKKGVDLLIDAFSKVAQRDPKLHLVIAGPDHDGLQADLERLSFKCGIGERITWTGMVTGDVKWGAYRAAEVFVLPSHSENFGIVVAEALACGLPVLISDKVNIWREIEADGAGLVAEDTLIGTVSLLETWLDLTPEAGEQMGRRARQCFIHRFEISQTANTLVNVLKSYLDEPRKNSFESGQKYL